MDYLDKARRVIDLEIAELRRLHDRLDGAAVERAITLLLRSLENRGKIVVVGVGKSGHIGEKIAATLTSTGSPAVVLNSLNALHGDLGVVADGDAVLALSASGETDELVNLLPALLRFDISLIALTGRADSTLALASHAWLDVSVTQEACPLNLAPTSSTTVMLALGDALAMVLLEARGFDKDDFAKFHPGGRLGRSLLVEGRVRSCVRARRWRSSPRSRTSARCWRKSRASGRARRWSSMRTDGWRESSRTAISRGISSADPPTWVQRPVGDFMTPRPVVIDGERLAVEILQLLEHSRIDDLVVVDAERRPIGLVDTQDLTRLKLL